jgi:HD-GYP domain-containing protein (c-di-GMP phosphodiesterase class II)
LGVEKALAVIEAGRGRTFDADVVDACVRLLRGKRYSVAEGQ